MTSHIYLLCNCLISNKSIVSNAVPFFGNRLMNDMLAGHHLGDEGREFTFPLPVIIFFYIK
jgi:hypothetical protein